MLKRKYGSRADWKRVLVRRYTEIFIEDCVFKGYVTLLQAVKVTEPLNIKYGTTPVCLVDDGYFWMQHFPEGGHYSLTTMLDSKGRIQQWYIDICKEVGYDSEKGPWMDDLFLDLVVLPDGQFIELDEDEFTLARSKSLLFEFEVELALTEFNRLKEEISKNRFSLLAETSRHFEELKKRLPLP